jgi:hypothetical protein
MTTELAVSSQLHTSPRTLTNNELGEHVEQIALVVGQTLADLKPFIEELWRRFDQLKRDETIRGCHTKKEFCEKVLGKTARAVQYMLAGGNSHDYRNKSEGDPIETRKGFVTATPKQGFLLGKSHHGHKFMDLYSWLHKALRRGDERQSLYCAAQFEAGGFVGAVWNTLEVVISEDIGLANTGLAQQVKVLRENFNAITKRSKPSEKPANRLPLTHAILLVCRSDKSRLVDHATIVGFESDASFKVPKWVDEKIQPPDWVFDVHTLKGRNQGKTAQDFFDTEDSLGDNPKVSDPYKRDATNIRTQEDPTEQKSTAQQLRVWFKQHYAAATISKGKSGHYDLTLNNLTQHQVKIIGQFLGDTGAK